MPDASVLYCLMGAVAANMLEGSPVWIMLVGPPSSGKTELLNSLLGIGKVFELASISNESAFLSATSSKDRVQGATGGILRQVGVHGAVVVNDFTSVLSLGKESLAQVLTVFRETFSGRWTRHVGADGGRHIRWGPGKVAFFGGVTGEIDRVQMVSASLGERWVYWRMDTTDGRPMDGEHDQGDERDQQPGQTSDEGESGGGGGGGAGMAGGVMGAAVRSRTNAYERTRRALKNSSKDGWREELRDLVTAFFMGLDLEFAHGDQAMLEEYRASGKSKRRELTDVEIGRLIRLGEVGVRCRSAVVREQYGSGHEILGVRETEAPVRLTTVLGQLLIGMEAIGVGEADRWRVLQKVVLDSMPMMRRVVLDKVRWAEAVGRREGVSLEELVKATGASSGVVCRTVEDLEVHGVVVGERRVGGLAGMLGAARDGGLNGAGKKLWVRLSARMRVELERWER